jgi:hypothetical protein
MDIVRWECECGAWRQGPRYSGDWWIDIHEPHNTPITDGHLALFDAALHEPDPMHVT